MTKRWTTLLSLATVCAAFGSTDALAQNAPNCTTMRKINIGVSVAPPNVVHTSPYVAKELGFFAKRCIDANIIQFEGGQSADLERRARCRAPRSSASATSRSARHEGAADLGPRAAHAAGLHGAPDVKTAKDLKGKRLSATGGVASVASTGAWGREVLKTAGPHGRRRAVHRSADGGTAPGLVAGQIDGVALHPEDVFLARSRSRRSICFVAAGRAAAELSCSIPTAPRSTGCARPRAVARLRPP
jgi:ABC-type nitrate/sulfonate/bicarbonate transport system substrate-binding protein